MNARVMVLLVTAGWIWSPECRQEAKNFDAELKQQERLPHGRKRKIIPVIFPDAPPDYAARAENVLCQLKTVQRVKQTESNWMDQVLASV